jgi:hypothetical protein
MSAFMELYTEFSRYCRSALRIAISIVSEVGQLLEELYPAFSRYVYQPLE